MSQTRARSQVQAEIEEKLLEKGFRMEASLSALDGFGHALIYADSGEMVEEEPDDEVIELAFQWSVLNDAVFVGQEAEEAEAFLSNIDLTV